ncbi:phosphoglycerol transferase [Paenibacillus sp. BIHB 4019]|uniref:Phosphoglycerol transferase n=1 Tax=Paenibacillus sp. BIHB 4019 TaxID=1870819 RepID=A0A1B2DLC4_9BACL|nr:LTA synthase family protein [Paenibacillus sp. BIHB 4019]ANY68514.1 phosphoglycerol transferase [Paenibacillus sp. BIHB 4019]
MQQKRYKALANSLQAAARWGRRPYGAELLLFFGVLLLKLYAFDLFIAVPNMKMNVYDVKIAIGTLALCSFWTLLLPLRGRFIALFAMNALFSAILYADLIYYRYFEDLISVPVLLQAGQVEALGGSIATLLEVKDFVLLADIPLLLGYAGLLAWKRRTAKPAAVSVAMPAATNAVAALPQRSKQPHWRAKAPRLLLSLALLTIGLMVTFGGINDAKRTWAKGLFESNWWNLSLYNVTGALGFHGYDLYRYAALHWLNAEAVSAETTSQVLAWTEQSGQSRAKLERDLSFGAYKGSNIILVQAEAFQNFMIGKSFNGQEITPNINKLVKSSAYFSSFYHQTAQGRTSDADFASNCSLQPLASGSVFIQYAGNEFQCLPQMLHNNGYYTSVFHAYEGSFWNRNTMYANMKYDAFVSKKQYELDEPIGWSLGDKSFFRQSLDQIAEQPQPFHSFLITLSSHHPYQIPAAEQTLSLGELEGTIMGDYLQAIHYVDEALGELIERLQQEGLWDHTIFAMYGDHDNSISDWSLFETFLGKPLNELEREQIVKQVPLLVHLPDDRYAGTYSSPSGQLDVAPTLLHLLGISSSELAMIGTPLITESMRQPQQNSKLVVLRNGAFTNGGVYYIPSADGLAEHGTCWNVAEQSPGELAPCLNLRADAQTELSMSDLLVIHNLIPELYDKSIVRAGSTQVAARK